MLELNKIYNRELVCISLTKSEGRTHVKDIPLNIPVVATRIARVAIPRIRPIALCGSPVTHPKNNFIRFNVTINHIDFINRNINNISITNDLQNFST